MAKHATMSDYRRATGFEALMGYLYLTGRTERILELAKKGTGAVNPNPLVGAVLVKDNRIIGEGYHQKYGQLHAERNAIADCYRRGENPAGAELYVTLEPCCHYGKTPPCTEAIIENKIVKVYVGSNDPNPLVDGGGIGQPDYRRRVS
jgi:diaminohydroxyphosphoribosylaminopyrimidine deaminase/5-amino-6-(5-phosphoribosylamino)uracil reductase